LDDTSATAAWNTHLTPDMQFQHIAKSFPPTPLQSLDTMSTQFNALGKRPLQLDMHDYPQSKRHASFDFPLFPTPPATTTSSWGLDSIPSVAVGGLPDEAADVCATWFNKYNVLPSDRHIDSLSQLTGEPADAIRSWFSQLLKQGMGGSQSDSAYKSQTALIQQEQQQTQHESFWDDHTYQTELPGEYNAYGSSVQPTLRETSTPGSSPNRDNSTVTVPVVSTRGSKKRCTPTEDQELLGRDPRKIYQCTRKCGKRYGRKNDWKRNEEEGYPCKSWVCSLCTIEGVENVKPCYRKYHFVQHFRNIHPEMNAEDFDEASTVISETEFPRKCGFCRHRFQSRQERIDHIADHFKQGKCMLDWRDEEDNDSHDSADDDNDDGPSDDGFGGKPSPQPPFDPRGGSGSKYSGSGGGDSGSAGPSSNGGFFQFQLSQLGESQLYCADQHIKPTTLSPNISQSSTSLPESNKSGSRSVSTVQGSLLDSRIRAAEDDKDNLAGDGLAQSVKEEPLTSSMDERTDSRLLEHPHWKHSKADIAASAPLFSPTSPVTPEDRSSMTPDVSLKRRRRTSTRSYWPMEHTYVLPADLKIPFLSVKLLGSGGFSTVDEVVHQQTGLHVGRKTLKNRDQTAIEELKKEVSVLQKLRHPHVIRFLGAYSRGDKMSILLSPVAETTLAVWLERSASQKPANLSETIVKMFGCLSSSVRYLHEQNVRHKDIKPQNILIVEGDKEFPHVVLSDFGVSSEEEISDDQYKPLTRQYIAPEVFEGIPRKQAADIWSLGCVFAEMASVPFSQDNMGWLAFRKAFSGRTGKHYWQDVSGIQDKLATFLAEAKTMTEQTVIRTLQSMLNANPDERPDAGALSVIFTPAPCCLNWPNDKATFPGPQEERGEVEMLAHQGEVDTYDHTHGHGRNIESDASLSNAKTWLDECSHTHEACRHTAIRDGTILPTRLIEIDQRIFSGGQNETIRARIVQTDAIEPATDKVDYVALSHVWSHIQPLLTSDTLSSMQTELSSESLPIAVTNAIAAAQDLGYKYLWVDSLCVLQDSEEDKERECASMASTFRNAALTIVLDQITDDKVGSELTVLGTTDKTYLTSSNGSTTDKSPTSGRLPASSLLPAGILTTPNFGWDTRAWVLQDRLLSRRFLHLGEQLYWECNTLKASETFPRGLPALVWEKVHTESGKGTQWLEPTATNGIRVLTDVMYPDQDGNQISTSITTPGKTRHDNDYLDIRQPGAFSTGSASSSESTTEPQSILPSASRLRDCQWVRKQGDDSGQGTVPVQTKLKVEDAQGSRSASKGQHKKRRTRRLNKACFQTMTLPGQNPGGGNGYDERMDKGNSIEQGNDIARGDGDGME
jgi:serine/threonine protein kinase